MANAEDSTTTNSYTHVEKIEKITDVIRERGVSFYGHIAE